MKGQMNKIPKLIGSASLLSSILAISPLTTAFAVEVTETIGILALLGGVAFYFFKLREPSSNNDKKRDSDDEEDIDNDTEEKDN